MDILLLLGVLLLAPILYAFVIGVRAFRQGGVERQGDRTLLALLALNLCEPLLNTVLVGVIILRTVHNIDSVSEDFSTVLLATAPMVILLAPVVGLFSDTARRVSVGLLLSGGARWLLTVVVLASAFSNEVRPEIGLVALLSSIAVLVTTTVWGKRQIDATSGVAPTRREAPVRSSF